VETAPRPSAPWEETLFALRASTRRLDFKLIEARCWNAAKLCDLPPAGNQRIGREVA
jgi:hypothetical protein